MDPGIDHLLREDLVSLQIILLVEAVCWYLLGRRLRGPLVFMLAGSVLLAFCLWTGDVRPFEVAVLGVAVALPAVALTRERLQPGSLGRAAPVVVLAPALVLGWVTVRALVIPAIACAEHLASHAVVHRQWVLEYHALLMLELEREKQTGQSRLGPRLARDEAVLGDDRIEVLPAVAPDGGWAATASALGCDNCRSFYMDSSDRVRSARRRRATGRDREVHWNEVEYLRSVLENGCFVLGDVPCR